VAGIAAQTTAERPSAVTTANTAVLCSLQDSFAVIADKAKLGVVTIIAVHTATPSSISSTEWTNPVLARSGLSEQTRDITTVQSQNPLTDTATGSGVIVRRSGDNYFILTNQHLIGDATRVKVHLQDDTELRGSVVGIDPVTDLAVVRISSPHLGDEDVVALGDSNDVKVGAWAIALGSPLGFEETMTLGIVSALQRQLEDEETYYTDLIQTDAAINPGNSGGPLIDVEGRVIGINTAIASPTGASVGLGFAIPINVAKAVLDSLIANGRVVRGWLGVGIQDLSPPLQEYYGSKNGVLVASVDRSGPAQHSGLQEEDVILSIDGAPVADIFRMQSMVASAKPGSTMRLKLLRDHRQLDVPAVVAESPNTPPPPSDIPDPPRQNIGLRVKPLSSDLAERVGLTGAKGVVVMDVEAGGVAEDAGLEVGDVITRMNGQSVGSDKEFAAMVQRVKQGGIIALRVVRDGSSRIIGIKRE
jgi:serine protease Do